MAAVGALGLTVAAAAGTSPASAAPARPTGSTTVNVVGYSIAAGVYSALETAFQATPAGKGVSFANPFGASTTQANDVVAGQPADVVNFSQSSDMQILVDNGIVSPKWATTGAGAKEDGFVADSVVAFVTRPGNPLKITSWSNLTKSGVQIVTPDPISSGSARWNLLEAYENQIVLHKTPAQAETFLNSLVGRVTAEPSSGSKSLSAFLAGTGNVLLAYEADAYNALQAGKAIQVVLPAQNILIQTPAALTATGVKSTAAKAFSSYEFSTAGQAIFAKFHFRPTVPSAAKAAAKLFRTYPSKDLTTIQSLGGWPAVIHKFFSSTGIITQVEANHGYTS
jgi:sulfate transport system substrate-binding protein